MRGERAVVVLAASDYDRLVVKGPSIVDHLLSGPVWDDEMAEAVESRAKAPSRDVEF